MSKEQLYESNKLIAEFMEIKIVARNGEDAVYMSESSAFPEYFRLTEYNRYHESMDLLMPVVEKIINDDTELPKGFKVLIDGNSYTIRFNSFVFIVKSESIMRAIYKAVLKYIDLEQNNKL